MKEKDPDKQIGTETKANKEAPEKTIGRTRLEEETPSNGTGSEASASASTADRDASSDLSAAYEKAKSELDEAVMKLRREVSNLDVAQARVRARTWVQENPTLAALLAAGAGLVVGQVLRSILRTPEPPPTWRDRLQAQSREIASHARRYAQDMGQSVAERATEASDILSKRAHEAGDVLSQHASDWGERLRDQADQFPDQARIKASQGLDVAESLINAAKTVTAAMIVKKISDLMRKS